MGAGEPLRRESSMSALEICCAHSERGWGLALSSKHSSPRKWPSLDERHAAADVRPCGDMGVVPASLSEGHWDAPGTGCALGALLGDMSRASRSAKAVYTARLKRSLANSTGLVPPNGTSDRRARAILMISAMLGAINLSRAVSDPNLSREILERTRDQLISFNKPAKAHWTADASRLSGYRA